MRLLLVENQILKDRSNVAKTAKLLLLSLTMNMVTLMMLVLNRHYTPDWQLSHEESSWTSHHRACHTASWFPCYRAIMILRMKIMKK